MKHSKLSPQPASTHIPCLHQKHSPAVQLAHKRLLKLSLGCELGRLLAAQNR